MTWLIVGATGQLGRALCSNLLDRGIKFSAWGSSELDIRINNLCIEKIAALNPSIVINAAAWTDVDAAESDPKGADAVNNFGALNLASASKAIGAVFVHVSTDYVFSGISSQPWNEADLWSPECIYGITKAAGEISVLNEYGEKSYILRTAWLYSQWGNNLVKSMARYALLGSDVVRVVNDQIGQPTSASDLANQIVETVLAKLPFGIYHGTNSGQVSRFDCALEVFKLCRVSVARLVPISTKEFVQKAKRPAYSVLGHDRWSIISKDGISVSPMNDWKIALNNSMPAIISAVKDKD